MQGPMIMLVIAGGAVVCITALALMMMLLMNRNTTESPTSGLPSTPPTFKIPGNSNVARTIFYSKTDCPHAARWVRVTLMDIMKDFENSVYTALATPGTSAERKAAYQQALSVAMARAYQSTDELRACKPGTTIDGKNIADLIQIYRANKGMILNVQLPEYV